MVVNDDAGCLDARSGFESIASKPAPTGAVNRPSMGAGLPAMVANDDAGCLDASGVADFFASLLAPTGFRAGRKFCERPVNRPPQTR
jgi:hypothetical protein